MTIYLKMEEAGVKIDHHKSDLYAQVTEESTEIVNNYIFKENVTKFTSEIDGDTWFDIPFGYDPFWDDKSSKESRGI